MENRMIKEAEAFFIGKRGDPQRSHATAEMKSDFGENM